MPSIAQRRPLGTGLFTPVITFFTNDEAQEVDYEALNKHITWIASNGSTGIVVLGSTGQRVCLTSQEKINIVKSSREALDAAGLTSTPLIAGAGDQCTKTSVVSIQEAADAGADYVLVLPPSYYPAFLVESALEEFYLEVADKSPIPIIIYSYPAVSSGLVMSSDLLIRLSQHPNIVGYKATDADIGKLSRVVAGASPDFWVVGGATDYFLGALAVGAKGTISGMGNLAPAVCNRIFELYSAGKLEEAKAIQHLTSTAEAVLGKGGLPIHHLAVGMARGIKSIPRRPLPASTSVGLVETGLAEILALENKLETLAK